MRNIKLRCSLDTSQVSPRQWELHNETFRSKLEPYFPMLRPMMGVDVNYAGIANSLSNDIYTIATEDCEIPVKSTIVRRRQGRGKCSNDRLEKLRRQVQMNRKSLKNNPSTESRKTFFESLRAFSELKKKCSKVIDSKRQTYHERQFRKNKWKYIERNLKQNGDSKTPENATRIVEFFESTYQSPQGNIDTANLPEYPQPNAQFNATAIKPRDIKVSLRKAKASSAPGPDGINYQLLKKIPTIHHILATLYNRILETGQIPSSWQEGTITLIYKAGDSNDPANYRPIALTSTISKVFHSILAKRMLQFATANRIIDPSIQKGFLHGVKGCPEHSTVLQSMIRHAKRCHKTLHCIWLDLKNAFGSVRHDLLLHSLRMANIPENILTYIANFYKNIRVCVRTETFTTRAIDLKVGVFQGDTLSPIIFLMAINPLLNLICRDEHHGYNFRGKSIVSLAFADDITLCYRNKKTAQRLLYRIDEQFKSVGLTLKPAKCKSLSICSGKVSGINFQLGGQDLENIQYNSFKFLGTHIFSHKQKSKSQTLVSNNLKVHLKQIDELPLRGSYKANVYSLYTTSLLRFPLMVQDLSNAAIKELDALVTKFLRKWLKLPNSTTTALILHRSGMNIQLPKDLYDQGHLAVESDPSDEVVKEAIVEKVQHPAAIRSSYRQHLTTNNAAVNKKNLCVQRNRIIAEHAETQQTQGQWQELTSLQAAETTFKALTHGISEATFRWLHKATTDTLPCKSYLRRINRVTDTKCSLCSHRPESLKHILNCCRHSLEHQRYTWRHNSVLKNLVENLNEHSCPGTEIRADLPPSPTIPISCRTIPEDILVTDQRPDITVINREAKAITLLELSICWDQDNEAAKARKQHRYEALVAELQENRWKTELVTIEIGSRGFSSNNTATALKNFFPSKSTRSKILTTLNQVALTCSHKIFQERDNPTWIPDVLMMQSF